MPSLGLVVILILAFAIGISWRAWVDTRVERSRLVRQIPLPLDYTPSAHARRKQSGLRSAIVLTGFTLVSISGMGAAILGRLATMQPTDAALVFGAYPLLHDLWGQIMALGPIVCVAMAVPGTYCISVGLGSHRC